MKKQTQSGYYYSVLEQWGQIGLLSIGAMKLLSMCSEQAPVAVKGQSQRAIRAMFAIVYESFTGFYERLSACRRIDRYGLRRCVCYSYGLLCRRNSVIKILAGALWLLHAAVVVCNTSEVCSMFTGGDNGER